MRFFGKVGYATNVEISPGVYEDRITEQEYFGDVIRNQRRLERTDVNSDIIISNSFSIVADAKALKDFKKRGGR